MSKSGGTAPRKRGATVAALALGCAAGPALAGPVGSGLAHTEAVARQRASTEVRLATPGPDCAASVRPALVSRAEIEAVSIDGETLVLRVRSRDAATLDVKSLRQLVSEACGTGS